MSYRPQQRTNAKGETIQSGDSATIVTRDGSKVSGEVGFIVSSGTTAVVRSNGYTYIGKVDSMEKGDTTK